MQIKFLNNSLSSQQPTLKSQAAQRTKLIKPDSEAIKKSTIDAVAQDVLEKAVTSETTPVYLKNTMASKGSAFTEEMTSIVSERIQGVSELVAQGIDRTKAKYIVASEMAQKGSTALSEFKNEKTNDVIEESTKETKEEKETKSTEEIVEEVTVEGTKIDPSSGERVKEVKVVKKVRLKAAHLPSTDTKLEKINTPKGQKVDVKI